jgi:hypothetical protein
MVASESVMSSKQYARKYSFSIEDATSPTLTRVVGLTFGVSDGATSATYPAASYQLTKGADFAYAANAGAFGTTSLLLAGDARSILNGDSFAGNDNGGADGSALAHVNATAPDVQLGMGDYTLTIAGTVKGNAATVDQAFSVTGSVHVLGQGCGSLA